MKIFVACLSVGLAALTSGLGQPVSVEVAFDQEQFLVNEELVAKVRITNFSGQTLALGAEEDWLSFTVDGGPGKVVSQRAVIPVKSAFSLESSKIGTRRINIAPYFDLSRPSRYTVTASVRIPQLKITVSSKPKAFNIINGTVLWQQDFGVPGDAQATNSIPEIRKYSLLQATHDRELKLYFRLTDSSGAKTYRVFPIDKLISFSNPEGQLDRFNNLHVLYQTGARSFLYMMINPDGVVIARESHEISNSKPVLRAEKDGRISVTGGVRRYAPTDLPPPPDSISTPDAAQSQP